MTDTISLTFRHIGILNLHYPRSIICIVFILLSISCGDVSAQSASDPKDQKTVATRAKPRTRSAIVAEGASKSRVSLQSAVERLRLANQDLAGYEESIDPTPDELPEPSLPAPLEDETELDPDVDPIEPARSGPVVDVHRELDEMKRQKEKRMMRIKSQLGKLQRMLHEQRAAAEQAQQQLEESTSQTAAAPPENTSDHAEGPPAAPQGDGKTPTAPARKSMVELHPPHKAVAIQSTDKSHTVSDGTAPDGTSDLESFGNVLMMSSKAVDRLELANSLFAMGRTESAHAIYASIEQPSLSDEDRIWLDYQLASCNRRLGNIADAEKLYRRVVATDPESTWSKYSKWWLELLRDQGKVSAELNQVQEALKTYRTKVELESNVEQAAP